jgi:predicted RNase H-like HicB family nuclease
MSVALLPHTRFAEAKSRLSEVMTDVVHRHQPQVIDRHNGKELMLLMGLADLSALLESFRFDPRVTVSDGEFVVRLPELNLIAAGESYEEAIAELVELVEQYGEDFLARLDFYAQTDRRQHLPWLLRFALTPPEQRAGLFADVPEHVRELVPST